MFENVPEQAEAKALLESALARRAGACVPLPRAARRREARPGDGVCGRAPRRARAGRPGRASGSLRPRAAGRPDQDRRHPGAAPRPPHAAVRGRPARVPDLRRALDERGGGGRAAEGSRRAAAVRGDRARGGRHRPSPGDDPVALPAGAVPAAVRASDSRGRGGAGAGALGEPGSSARPCRGRPARQGRAAAGSQGRRAPLEADRDRSGRLPRGRFRPGRGVSGAHRGGRRAGEGSSGEGRGGARRARVDGS